MVVCCITSIILLITLCLAFNSVLNLSLTEYTNAEQLIQYNTNEQYLKSQSSSKQEELKNLSSKELEELRINDKNEYIEVKKARAVSNIMDYSTWIIFSLIFFTVHWMMYKKTQNN
ncbi:MAG TPA: hypothetical protein LFW21_01055 [Rickettsia endosymbiont of Pyrocoelia pectoralis]|nr:hypothetical protein [Rickettsia endosymbiont of Pyrocoelia pectoralis]